MAGLGGMGSKLSNSDFMKPLKYCKWLNKRRVM